MSKIFLTQTGIMFFNHAAVHSQDDVSEVTAIAKLSHVKTTGKQHESYYFARKIEDVLSGETEMNEINSQKVWDSTGG